MRLKSAFLITAILLAGLFAWSPPVEAQDSSVTVAAGGVYPAGTTFSGVSINGLQSGYGVVISGGSAAGQFCTILLGVSALGPQNITIEGTASSGSRSGSVATFSGSCSINMGDGSPPLTGVPFTATITADSNGQGTIGLVLGITTLPAATVNQGSMTIQ